MGETLEQMLAELGKGRFFTSQEWAQAARECLRERDQARVIAERWHSHAVKDDTTVDDYVRDKREIRSWKREG